MRATLLVATAGLLLALGLEARADPDSDDFERAALGPDWARLQGSEAEIVNGHDAGIPEPGNWLFIAWVAAAFAADEFCEAVRADSIPPDVLTQVFVRRRASDLARYGFHWNGDPGNSRLEIKFDGVPTPQTRILAQVNAPPPAPGDALRLEASGTDPVILRAYHNGALVIEAADAAPNRITIAGHVGMVARLRQGGTAPPAAPVFASWAGGSLAAAAVGDARAPEHAPALTAAPSPFAAAVALRAPDAAGESIDIVTPLGHRVRRLVLGAGGLAHWDGRDEAGATLPRGVYFARLLSRGATARVVKLD